MMFGYTNPVFDVPYLRRIYKELRDAYLKSLAGRDPVLQSFLATMKQENANLKENEEHCGAGGRGVEGRTEKLRVHREATLKQRHGWKPDVLRNPSIPVFAFSGDFVPKACCYRCKALHGLQEQDEWAAYDVASFDWDRGGKYDCGCAEPLMVLTILYCEWNVVAAGIGRRRRRRHRHRRGAGFRERNATGDSIRDPLDQIRRR